MGPPMSFEEVFIADDLASAERAVSALRALDRDARHAVDTEVADIDVKKVGPVGNGRVTCVTVYSGPSTVFGERPGQTLWIDATKEGVLEVFKEWFEDAEAKKVWHNYGFDRHVLNNAGVEVAGFAGDTMHMARLFDAARQRSRGGDGYSLESLSSDYLADGGGAKIGMKKLFGIKSAAIDVLGLQENPVTRNDFICYAAYDAKSTYEVHAHLTGALKAQSWRPVVASHGRDGAVADMLDFYLTYFVPFGELLTDMERVGIYVDAANHLTTVEEQASRDHDDCLQTWRDWAVRLLGDDGRYLNPSSTLQIQTLLYGGALAQSNSKNKDPKNKDTTVKRLPEERAFEAGDPIRLAREGRPPVDDPVAVAEKKTQLVPLETFLQCAGVLDLKRELKKYGATLPTPRKGPDGKNIPIDPELLKRMLREYARDGRVPPETTTTLSTARSAVANKKKTTPVVSSAAKAREELSEKNTPEKKEAMNEAIDALMQEEHSLEVLCEKALGSTAPPGLDSTWTPDKIAKPRGVPVKELKALLDLWGANFDKPSKKKKLDFQRRVLAAWIVGVSAPNSAPNAKTDAYDDLSDQGLRGQLIARNMKPPEGRDAMLSALRADDRYAQDLGSMQDESVDETKTDGTSETNASNLDPAELASTSAAPASSSTSTTTACEGDNELLMAEKSSTDPTEHPLTTTTTTTTNESEGEKELLFEVSTTALKKRKITVKVATHLLKPIKYTTTGFPSVSADVLRTLAGRPELDPPKHGPAYEAFGGGESGHSACVALDALCQMGSIDTMLNTFIRPLKTLADANSRVHCSLNLNTETGRLSSRRPNLQNQPALEKDKYLIRKAFQAEPGKKLVVADYGQLELRLLAAITNCRSMLDAFEQGGCFHSRTAVGMYDQVREAVESGAVLLERGPDIAADDPRPLVKDKFAAERRKAKTLNFSIAYGKTAHGLAKDWETTREEAEETLQAWYADRPEVKQWQDDVIKLAKKTGYTTTLMGRRRQLPDILSNDKKFVGRGSRAAINTPIQGSAADVVMMAMLNINNSQLLRSLGWKLLLQIHDEVILEGPESSADDALAEVVRCMENPFDNKGLKQLDVALTVDAKSAYTWYEAK